MEEWKEYKLGDVASVQTGPFGSQLHNKDYVKVGTPIVTVEHLGARLFSTQNLPCVSDVDKVRLGKYTLEEGDIVFSRVGSVDRCSYVSAKEVGWLFSGRCLRVRCNDTIQPMFLYYYLQKEEVKQSIRNIAVGATMPSINTKLLSEIQIIAPSKTSQKLIASTLSSLDDKIECNIRINDNFTLSFLLLTCFVLWLLKLRNDNLQQQARALYKSWFVDFDPFKDGQFEDSELGMIPHGWSVKQLGEITSQVSERVKERVDVKVLSPITTGELVLSEEYFSKQVFSESISKYIVVKPSDFAYNPARVNIGSLGINEYDFDGCVSPVYVVFRCEGGYQYFFDLFRRTEAFKEEVRTRAIGGVRQSLAYKDFSLIKVVYPPIDVIHSFNQVYSRILAKTKHNNVETTRLASIRDTLLPKLISGELKIS